MQQETANSTLILKQRATIRENARYLKEQEQLIQTTIEIGNNQIHQLTFEADTLVATIATARMELMAITKQIDERRFELLSLF